MLLQQTTRHILIGVGAIFALVVSGYVIVANSDAYRTARQFVTTHPKVIAALGEGIETRLQWGGRFKVNVSEPVRRMQIVLRAEGRKTSGAATVEMSRKNEDSWVIEHAELRLPEGDTHLLAPVAAQNGAAPARPLAAQ